MVIPSPRRHEKRDERNQQTTLETMKTTTHTAEPTTREKLQAIGEGAMSCIRDMVRALDEETAREDWIDSLDESTVSALVADYYAENPEEEKGEGETPSETLARLMEEGHDPEGYEWDEDEARDRINEDPLSFEVRSGWTTPGSPMEAEEFCLLLSTGGPAVRIIGAVGQHGTLERPRLQAQDWFTAWQDVDLDSEDREYLETYVSHFSADY